MLKARITEMPKATLVETGEQYLDVHFEIYELDKKEKEVVLATKRLAFPLTVSQEDLASAIRESVDLFETERQASIDRAEQDAADKNADELINTMVGVEL